MFRRFANRREAGRELAFLLRPLRHRKDVVLLALPRGGVPVAYEVAKELGLPLDVLTVRKIGAPGNEEFAVGAVAAGGEVFIDEPTITALGLTPDAIESLVAAGRMEVARRERLYHRGRPLPDMEHKAVVLVDDGLATGATMRAAIRAVIDRGASQVIVAVPVCAPATCRELESDTGVRCVCLQGPEPFQAVGLWYRHFGQTSDEEVEGLLQNAGKGTRKG